MIRHPSLLLLFDTCKLPLVNLHHHWFYFPCLGTILTIFFPLDVKTFASNLFWHKLSNYELLSGRQTRFVGAKATQRICLYSRDGNFLNSLKTFKTFPFILTTSCWVIWHGRTGTFSNQLSVLLFFSLWCEEIFITNGRSSLRGVGKAPAQLGSRTNISSIFI